MNNDSANPQLSPGVLVALQEKFAGENAMKRKLFFASFIGSCNPAWMSAST